ncbi:hypothetical protein [Pseudoxanthomonas sp. 10H]|uniref:hypothetical protein n=1 Tax=Pseudoxanthomonas sp. 10H TaxID=3242729 RepID=UPI003555C3D1
MARTATWLVTAPVLLAAAAPAHADRFHALVEYACDRAGDTLAITYSGAYDEAGEARKAARGEDAWDPWDLLEIVDDEQGTRVTEIREVERTCPLSDARYRVVVRGAPGNGNILGRCGATASAQVRVWRGTELVFDEALEKDCHGGEPLVTAIELRPGAPPRVTRTPPLAFYR